MLSKLKQTKAFTLLEVLTVICIMAIVFLFVYQHSIISSSWEKIDKIIQDNSITKLEKQNPTIETKKNNQKEMKKL